MSDIDFPSIDQCPRLLAWYRQASAMPRETCSAADLLLLGFCEILADAEDSPVLKWVDAVNGFLFKSTNAWSDFCLAQQRAQDDALDLIQLSSDLGQIASHETDPEPFRLAADRLADATELVAFRFLSAWTAYQMQRFEQCCVSCERVEQPFGAIYSLQGQALIALQRYSEAIECLRIAVELDPNEVMSWFQLTKVCLATGALDEAWEAISKCRELVPHDVQIDLVSAILALEFARERKDPRHLNLAMKVLGSHFADCRDNPEVVGHLLELAVRTENEDKMNHIMSQACWQKLASHQEFYRHIANILRLTEASAKAPWAPKLLDHLQSGLQCGLV